MGNALIEASGRRVDWIHIPILDQATESFFAPLAQLNPRGARIFLGMIHHMESLPVRLQMARKFLPEFGLAAYCGFGRLPQSEMPAVLEEHLSALSAIKQ